MKILFLIPLDKPARAGVVTTSYRIAEGLQRYADIEMVCTRHLTPQQISSEVKAAAPDLIQIFNLQECTNFLNPLRRLMIPLVVTATGTDFDSGLTQRTTNALKTIDLVICNTPYAACIIRRATACNIFIARKGSILHLHPPLPTRGILRPPTRPTIILHVAGLRPVKRNLLAIRTFKRLGKIARHLVIAGDRVDPAYAARCDRQICRLGGRVSLVNLDHHDMATLYPTATLNLNTSASEGCSNAIIEAASFGVPSVATDIPGNRAVIKDSVTGFLCRNPEELRSKATRLIENRRLRKRLGRNARQYARARFNPKNEIRDYLRAYEQILKRPGAPSWS